MIRRKNQVILKSSVPRGGFDVAMGSAISTTAISGRGTVSQEPTNNVKFEAPLKPEDTTKPKKMKNGMYSMKRKVKKEDPKHGMVDGPIDDAGHINWDWLDEQREHPPCQKLLKKLKKQMYD
jgi:hypothetical protein